MPSRLDAERAAGAAAELATKTMAKMTIDTETVLEHAKEIEMVDAVDGGSIEITDANFVDEIEAAEGLSVVDFWAEWCGPCRIVGPVVDDLAREYAGRVKIGKLDVDANPQTAFRFNVRSIPSILFFKGGEVVDTVVGAHPKAALESKILEHV